MAEPDFSEKKQVTARMTPGFAADLQLIVSYFGITNVSQVLYGSVAAQANAIRKRKAGDRHALARALREGSSGRRSSPRGDHHLPDSQQDIQSPTDQEG